MINKFISTQTIKKDELLLKTMKNTLKGIKTSKDKRLIKFYENCIKHQTRYINKHKIRKAAFLRSLWNELYIYCKKNNLNNLADIFMELYIKYNNPNLK